MEAAGVLNKNESCESRKKNNTNLAAYLLPEDVCRNMSGFKIFSQKKDNEEDHKLKKKMLLKKITVMYLVELIKFKSRLAQN